jgi:hypothetical protein
MNAVRFATAAQTGGATVAFSVAEKGNRRATVFSGADLLKPLIAILSFVGLAFRVVHSPRLERGTF